METKKIIKEKSVSKELIPTNNPTNYSNFIWIATRISFWIMIFLWILAVILPEHEGLWFNDWIYVLSIPFTFVFSIIHLVKCEEKTLAIVSLVISSIGVMLLVLGMFIGVLQDIVGVI